MAAFALHVSKAPPNLLRQFQWFSVWPLFHIHTMSLRSTLLPLLHALMGRNAEPKCSLSAGAPSVVHLQVCESQPNVTDYSPEVSH